jgi:dTDP-4-dehydrorhamnose reductase
MKNILILGAKGNLGSQLHHLLPQAIAWDRDDIDLTDTQSAQEKIRSTKNVEVIINCVAYNDVDGAESNTDVATMLNVKVPTMLAKLASELDITLVHFSTGYVFSGKKSSYEEHDKPDPISVYGQTKADGEHAVKEFAKHYYIVRTNLLFGPKGQSETSKQSVVEIMREVGTSQQHLKGITDEISSFTYTPDLAEATIHLLKNKKPKGVYHLVNEGTGSWYDLAVEIFTILGWKITEIPLPEPKEKLIAIEKITSDSFVRAAKRPTHAVLKNTKLPKLRTWQEALKAYLKNL